MKKIVLCLFLTFMAFSAFAAREATPAEDNFEYDSIVMQMRGVKAPYETGDYIVFTAPRTSRQQGIAFDFENYSTIHRYMVHNVTDSDGEITDTWMFYILKKPAKTSQIKYRIILDGLWTTDDTNTNIVYDDYSGIPFSYLAIQKTDPVITETESNGYTKFVCFAESGKTIRLGGTFTNWDSWIYEMQEVSYGKYEISLPLPKGTYYYNFYEGMRSFNDKSNPVKGYTPDGKTASCITVK